ncbi:MAG: DUF4135 domain-containing protein [Sandaracinaceae bacterium]|nr:DUF4135 domain-containing protein [Sandaracinaceae bacterium]
MSLLLRGAPSGHVRAVVSARVIALPWPCELEPGVVDDLTEHLLRSLRPLGTSAAHAEGPVWSPLMAEVCARWSHQLAELVDRLHDDLAALQATFGLSGATRLQRIFAGLSDPHHGGRTVHILCFHSARVVYKPRSIEIERRALEVMGWLGSRWGTRCAACGRSRDRSTPGVSTLTRRRLRPRRRPTRFTGARVCWPSPATCWA